MCKRPIRKIHYRSYRNVNVGVVCSILFQYFLLTQLRIFRFITHCGRCSSFDTSVFTTAIGTTSPTTARKMPPTTSSAGTVVTIVSVVSPTPSGVISTRTSISYKKFAKQMSDFNKHDIVTIPLITDYGRCDVFFLNRFKELLIKRGSFKDFQTS